MLNLIFLYMLFFHEFKILELAWHDFYNLIFTLWCFVFRLCIFIFLRSFTFRLCSFIFRLRMLLFFICMLLFFLCQLIFFLYSLNFRLCMLLFRICILFIFLCSLNFFLFVKLHHFLKLHRFLFLKLNHFFFWFKKGFKILNILFFLRHILILGLNILKGVQFIHELIDFVILLILTQITCQVQTKCVLSKVFKQVLFLSFNLIFSIDHFIFLWHF
jgi:hypothetical protein